MSIIESMHYMPVLLYYARFLYEMCSVFNIRSFHHVVSNLIGILGMSVYFMLIQYGIDIIVPEISKNINSVGITLCIIGSLTAGTIVGEYLTRMFAKEFLVNKKGRFFVRHVISSTSGLLVWYSIALVMVII